jgi:hypothetical protein
VIAGKTLVSIFEVIFFGIIWAKNYFFCDKKLFSAKVTNAIVT